MKELRNFFDNDLNDLQKGIFCLLLTTLFLLMYRNELNEKKKYEPLTNYDKYLSFSSIRSLFVIVLFAIASIVYFIKVIK